MAAVSIKITYCSIRGAQRSFTDRPDTSDEFQIHPIYIFIRDTTGRESDVIDMMYEMYTRMNELLYIFMTSNTKKNTSQ